MDNELYDLSAEVYKRLKWEPKAPNTLYFIKRDERGEQIPIYTSDYLLEKLPKRVRDPYGLKISYVQMKRTSSLYYFWYGELGTESEAYLSYADIPLKALLKLTIALSDAGELK